MNIPIDVVRTVIDTLTDSKTDFKKIGIALAKEDPMLFLRLSETLDPRVEHLLSYYTKQPNPNKIVAIRDVRELDRTLGLKEAKEFVETVIDKYNLVPKENN